MDQQDQQDLRDQQDQQDLRDQQDQQDQQDQEGPAGTSPTIDIDTITEAVWKKIISKIETVATTEADDLHEIFFDPVNKKLCYIALPL
jgi:hypothetical protein